MSDTATPSPANPANPTDDRMDLGGVPVMRWDDPRVKRLFIAVFVLGAGFGSISTSLAFGFLFV